MLYIDGGTPYACSKVGVLEKNLSHKNCDEIFGIFDVEKFAYFYSTTTTFIKKENVPTLKEIEDAEYISEIAYNAGFNKAIELNKDKLFTLNDIKKAIEMAKQGTAQSDGLTAIRIYEKYSESEIIESLNRPTEIEVEIEMDFLLFGQCDCLCHKKGFDIRHIMPCCSPKRVEIPKLDENGCLILKRT